MEKKNDLLELTFEFAVEIIEYTEQLESLKKYVLARQLMKSGTSIGANSHEAQIISTLSHQHISTSIHQHISTSIHQHIN